MSKSKDEMVTIYIFGKRHKVPKTLTVQKAMEYVGYRFIRNCGCRGGVCGACLITYRIRGNYKLENALACQTSVEEGMEITQVPFVPAKKSLYDLKEIPDVEAAVKEYYPEVFRCLACNTCTKACPQDIEVMEYIQAIIKGEYQKASELSFPCIMCGSCVARCPAEISQPNVSLLVRRIFVRQSLPVPENVSRRVEEIKQGKFDQIIDELVDMDIERIKEIYSQREQEPLEKKDWKPRYPDFPANLLQSIKKPVLMGKDKPQREGSKLTQKIR